MMRMLAALFVLIAPARKQKSKCGSVPRVEELEGRWTPATDYWIYYGPGTTGLWSDPRNWSTGRIPQPSDEVFFQWGPTSGQGNCDMDIPGTTVESLTLTNWNYSLILSGTLSVSSLDMASGEIDQPNGSSSALTVTGAGMWSAGAIGGTTSLSYLNLNLPVEEGNFSIQGGVPLNMGDTINVNSGMLTINAHSTPIEFQNNAGIVNNGIIQVQGGTGNITAPGGATGIIDNYGTFETVGPPPSSGGMTCALPLVNDASAANVFIEGPWTYEFTQPGAQNGVSLLQKNGTTEIWAGATLWLDYGFTQQNGLLTTNGSGTAYLNGGAVRVDGGSVSFAQGNIGTLSCNNTVTMDGGTLYVMIDATQMVNSGWTTSGGGGITITGNASVNVTTVNIPPNGMPHRLWSILLVTTTGSSATVTSTVQWGWNGFQYTLDPYTVGQNTWDFGLLS